MQTRRIRAFLSDFSSPFVGELQPTRKIMHIGGLAVIIAVLATVLFGQLPGNGRWNRALENAAHGPASAVVTIALIE